MAMPGWSEGRLRLAEYLTELRSELDRARAEAAKDDLAFDVDTASIEVDIGFSLERSGRPAFWVLAPAREGAKDEQGLAYRDRQRLTVRLTPRPDAVSGSESTASPPASLPRVSPSKGE